MSNAIRALVTALALVAGCSLLAFYVLEFGVNIPINDDWNHVETSLKWVQNGIDRARLFATHNEHCMAVPRIWYHSILLATGGNFKIVLLGNAGMAFALLALLLYLVQTRELALLPFTVVTVSIALAVSAWCQWQNLLWGFQIPYFMLPLFTVIPAIVLLRANPYPFAFVVTIGFVWLSVVSNGNGIFVAWALIPAFFARWATDANNQVGNHSRWWVAGYFLNLVCATTVAAWQISSSRGKSYGSIGAILNQPLEVLLAGLSVLGAPFVPAEVFHGKSHLAPIAGLFTVGYALGLIWLLYHQCKLLPWSSVGPGLALALYGLLSVASVVYGRSELLLAGPIESRYLAFALSWILGLLICGSALAPRLMPPWRAAWTVSTCLVAIVFSTMTVAAMPLFVAHGKNMRTALLAHQEILRNAADPERRAELQKISRHFGADRLSRNLQGLLAADLLHQDLRPNPTTTDH